MATFSTPVLTISGAPTPGQSTVKVEYDITFSAFDQAADQPYAESVKLIGDDTNVPVHPGNPGDPAAAGADDAIATLVPAFIFFPSIVRASMIVAPQTTLKRTHTRTYSNSVLDEDQPAIPNPDEIRAVVTLTPQPPAVAGPTESNLVELTL
jgi:hypothetical protein